MEFAINMLKELSKIRNPFLDTLMGLLTKLGEELIIFGVICVLFWCIDKKSAYKLGLVFFGSGIAVQGAKVSFCIERPFIIDPTLKPVESAIKNATGYSFPSGHTQGATSLFGYLAFNLKRLWLKILCVFAFLLVGFTRMYLGVHTIYDVAVSMLLALLAAFIVTRFSVALFDDKNVTKLSVVLGSLSVVLCIYSFILAFAGHAERSQINDCFKTGGAGLGFAIGYYLERKHINFDPENAALPWQALKLIIGVLGALGLKSGLKLIAPDNLAIDFIRYFLTIIWVVALYPFLFKKFFERKVKKSKNAL